MVGKQADFPGNTDSLTHSDNETNTRYKPGMTAQNTPLQSWNRVRAKLRFICGEAAFNSWIKPLHLVEVDANEVVLACPTRFIREWVNSHYHEELLTSWQNEISTVYALNIIVQQSTNDVTLEDSVMSAPRAAVTEHHADVIHATLSSRPAQGSAEAFSQPEEPARFFDDIVLDPRFTFDEFVVASHNQLAAMLAKHIAEQPAVSPHERSYYICSAVGMGKTHLLQAIAHRLQQDGSRKALYLSAEKFMYEFIRALRQKSMLEFKQALRSVDVLLIDDIQFIAGKKTTQEEFSSTLSAIMDSGKQVVVSCDRTPANLQGLESRIMSRFVGGMVAEIQPCSYETRLTILEKKLALLSKTIGDTIEVCPATLQYIANSVNNNVRELEGALNKVVAHARLMKQDITLETTQLILRDVLRSSNRAVTVERIKQLVAEHCQVTMAELNSQRRLRSIARPRQLAMYLTKRFTSHSLPEIGRAFGGKDHTTVLHAVKRVEELCAQDDKLRKDVEELSRQIQQ